jgi:intracellular septation protein A
LATLALTLFLPQSPSILIWLAGLILGGTAIAWLILIHYRMLDPDIEISAPVRVARSVVAYLLILVFFTSIYRTRVRSLVTATSIAAVAFAVSLSLLGEEGKSLGKAMLYSAVIGLVLGETTWALNYWRANVMTVGVLLMLAFYVFVGIVREHIKGTLDRKVLAEFLIVSILGIWLITRLGTG